MAFGDLYRRLESLTGTPGAASESDTGVPMFASMGELKRYCARQYDAGNEHAGRCLLAAKEAEMQGRGAAFLRQANMSRVNRCDLQGEIVQPAKRRR